MQLSTMRYPWSTPNYCSYYFQGIGGAFGLGGSYGAGGPGGPGGMGETQHRQFSARHHVDNKYDCDILDCGHDGDDVYNDAYAQNYGAVTPCCQVNLKLSLNIYSEI